MQGSLTDYVNPICITMNWVCREHTTEDVMPLRCFVKIVMEVQINILPDHINITQRKVNAKRLKFNYKVHPLVTL